MANNFRTRTATSPRLDTRIPLTWLISTTGAFLCFLALILWNVAGSNSTLVELKKSVEAISTKADATKEVIYTIQRAQDAQSLRIEALERIRK